MAKGLPKCWKDFGRINVDINKKNQNRILDFLPKNVNFFSLSLYRKVISSLKMRQDEVDISCSLVFVVENKKKASC